MDIINEKARGVYEICNLINHKRYIGQSKDIRTRSQHHINSLKLGNHYNVYLQREYNKYGDNAFVGRVLSICSETEIDRMECYWIKKYKTADVNYGYNLDSGGNLNKKHSRETRKKISESNIGKKVTKEQRRKMSEAKLGKPGAPRTPEWNRKVSEARKGQSPWTKGKKRLQETKRKISEALKGHTVSEETRLKISETKRKKRDATNADE